MERGGEWEHDRSPDLALPRLFDVRSPLYGRFPADRYSGAAFEPEMANKGHPEPSLGLYLSGGKGDWPGSVGWDRPWPQTGGNRVG